MAKNKKINKRVSAASEQRKIERMLGEEFVSLAQARRALRRETEVVSERTEKRQKQAQKAQQKAIKQARKVSSKKQVVDLTTGKKPIVSVTTKEVSIKPIVSLRDLSTRQRKGIADALKDYKYAGQLDKTLKKGEYLAAEVQFKYRDKNGKVVFGYAKTHHTFTSFKALFTYMQRYINKNKKQGVSDLSIARWMNRTKILTTRQDDKQWDATKKKEQVQHAKEKFVKKVTTKKFVKKVTTNKGKSKKATGSKQQGTSRKAGTKAGTKAGIKTKKGKR